MERNIFYCKLKKYLNQYCDLDQPHSIIKQPIIIIPTPSPFCNEKWNYKAQGKDWECTCKEGKKQSPVNLPCLDKEKSVLNTERTLFEFYNIKKSQETPDSSTEIKNNKGNKNNTKDSELKFVFEDHKVKIYGNFGRLLTPDLVKYEAELIEFHSDSEHTINSKKFDLEAQIHFFCPKFPGKKAVLSILFQMEAGIKNKFFDNDIDFLDLPSNLEPHKTINKDFFSITDFFIYSFGNDKLDLTIKNKFLPAFVNNKKIDFKHAAKIEQNNRTSTTLDFSYFSYEGSLTSPPCQEDVLWYIIEKPLPIGLTALEYFRDAMKVTEVNSSESENCIDSVDVVENRRELQTLGERKVSFYNSELEMKRCDFNNERANNNGDDKDKVKESKGHFEKYQGVITKYFYVNSDETLGVPGSINVSPEEAGVISYSKNKLLLYGK